MEKKGRKNTGVPSMFDETVTQRLVKINREELRRLRREGKASRPESLEDTKLQIDPYMMEEAVDV